MWALVTRSSHVCLNAEAAESLAQVPLDVHPIRVTLTTDLTCLISLSTAGRLQVQNTLP